MLCSSLPLPALRSFAFSCTFCIFQTTCLQLTDVYRSRAVTITAAISSARRRAQALAAHDSQGPKESSCLSIFALQCFTIIDNHRESELKHRVSLGLRGYESLKVKQESGTAFNLRPANRSKNMMSSCKVASRLIGA